MNRLRRIVSLGILCLIFPSMYCAGFLDDLPLAPPPPTKQEPASSQDGTAKESPISFKAWEKPSV
ncbi:MAG: hypothetical protein R3B83_02690 [Nitrospirales bacterium]|nr:hypothetical protein [Nitrospirales bacterium]